MLASPWFAAGLGLAAGFGLFLIFINRILSYLHSKLVKLLVALGGLMVLPVGFCWLGFTGGRAGMVTVAFVLLGLAVGELRRIALHRRYRASSPVERGGTEPALRRPFTTTDLRWARYVVPVPARDSLSAAHRGSLRILHLSDLHVNDDLPTSYYQGVIDQANQAGPDLVFITGDFINRAESAPRLESLFSGLQHRWGIYAVLGNHDYWAGAAAVRQALHRAGVHVLGNGWQRIRVDGLGNLLILGCEQPWSRDSWKPPVIQDDDLVLALSHTADYVYQLNKLGTLAMFSGHYHAGQFRLPLLGAPFVPSRYGRRFCQGHFHVDGTHLFVSAGVGAAEPALRLYCPPDIFIVDLVGE
jgi:hypothetical protein